MRAGHFKEQSSCSFLAKSLLNSILPVLMAVMLTSCMDMAEKQKPEDVNSDISAIDLSARTPRPVAGSPAAAPSGKPFSFFGFGGAAAPAEKPVASDAPVIGGAVADGDGYALNFDNAPVADVAKVVLGDVLGLSYSIDPRVQGIVNLSSGRAVPKGEILYVFENALRMSDIGLVKSGSLYRLVPVSDVAGAVSVAHGNEAGYGLSVLPLRYVNAANIAKLMEGFAAKPGTVRVDSARNILIFQGSSAERQNAMDTALSFDADWMKDQSVGVYPVHNVSPDVLIDELQKVFDTAEGGNAQGLVKFETVARLNAVLVVARKPEGLTRAATWITRLDRADPAASMVKVYQVKYGDAKQLAAVLNDAFSGRSSGETSSDTAPGTGSKLASRSTPIDPNASTPTTPGQNSETGNNSGFGALGSTRTPATSAAGGSDAAHAAGASALASLLGGNAGGSEAVHVTPNLANNSLLIYARGENYAAVERVLRLIDRPSMQISIQATIAEVSLNQDLQYGVQWYLKSKILGTNKDQGSAGLSTALTDGALARVLPGFNLVLGSGTDPAAILSALNSVTTVKMISSPSLQVMDNQVATLQVGDEVPITTQTANALPVSGVSTIVNSIQYMNTGVILRVVPRVNASGMVMLEIEQEISSVANTASANTLTPTVSQRKIKSSISVADGQTVMLGGLISEQQNNSRTGIPFVENIQFLGDMFSNSDKSRNRTELLIFIKPQVIRDPMDAQRVAEDLRAKILFGSPKSQKAPPANTGNLQ